MCLNGSAGRPCPARPAAVLADSPSISRFRRPLPANPWRERIGPSPPSIRTCEANRDRMRRDPCRTRGLPVGSGIAESACNCIAGNRLKQSGGRWSKAGANAVPAIGRCFENMRWPDLLDWRARRAAAAYPKKMDRTQLS